MTWGEGRPSSRIPDRVKAAVRRRDKVCQLGYEGICTGRIEQFDHPDGLAAQGLARTPVRSSREVVGVCTACHKRKTQTQAADGRRAAIAKRGHVSRRYRESERHPGDLR